MDNLDDRDRVQQDIDGQNQTMDHLDEQVRIQRAIDGQDQTMDHLDEQDRIQQDIEQMHQVLSADEGSSDEDERLQVVDESYIPEGDLQIIDQSNVPETEIPHSHQEPILQEDAPPIVVLLGRNRQYQQLIESLLYQVRQALENNKAEQKEVESQVLAGSNASFNRGFTKEKSSNRPMISFFKPYFRDENSNAPPINDETKERNRLLQQDPFVTTRNIWSQQELKSLKEGVHRDRQRRITQPLWNRKELLQDKLANPELEDWEKEKLEEQMEDVEDKIAIVGAGGKVKLDSSYNVEIDWMRVSSMDLDGERTPIECKQQWEIVQKDELNKGKWSTSEENTLVKLAKKYKERDWETIALKLGTGRSAFQCIQHYRQNLDTNFSKKYFSPADDKKMLQLVEKFRSGNYVPHTKVAYFMEGFTSKQICMHWTSTLNPEIKTGKWSKEEDNMLRNAVQKYGTKHWPTIANCVPGRTFMQVRDRWCLKISPGIKRGPFDPEEDLLMVNLIVKHGLGNWKKVAADMASEGDGSLRTSNSLLIRFRNMVIKLKKERNRAKGKDSIEEDIPTDELLELLKKQKEEECQVNGGKRSLKNKRKKSKAKIRNDIEDDGDDEEYTPTSKRQSSRYKKKTVSYKDMDGTVASGDEEESPEGIALPGNVTKKKMPGRKKSIKNEATGKKTPSDGSAADKPLTLLKPRNRRGRPPKVTKTEEQIKLEENIIELLKPNSDSSIKKSKTTKNKSKEKSKSSNKAAYAMLLKVYDVKVKEESKVVQNMLGVHSYKKARKPADDETAFPQKSAPTPAMDMIQNMMQNVDEASESDKEQNDDAEGGSTSEDGKVSVSGKERDGVSASEDAFGFDDVASSPVAFVPPVAGRNLAENVSDRNVIIEAVNVELTEPYSEVPVATTKSQSGDERLIRPEDTSVTPKTLFKAIPPLIPENNDDGDVAMDEDSGSEPDGDFGMEEMDSDSEADPMADTSREMVESTSQSDVSTYETDHQPLAALGRHNKTPVTPKKLFKAMQQIIPKSSAPVPVALHMASESGDKGAARQRPTLEQSQENVGTELITRQPVTASAAVSSASGQPIQTRTQTVQNVEEPKEVTTFEESDQQQSVPQQAQQTVSSWVSSANDTPITSPPIPKRQVMTQIIDQLVTPQQRPSQAELTVPTPSNIEPSSAITQQQRPSSLQAQQVVSTPSSIGPSPTVTQGLIPSTTPPILNPSAMSMVPPAVTPQQMVSTPMTMVSSPAVTPSITPVGTPFLNPSATQVTPASTPIQAFPSGFQMANSPVPTALSSSSPFLNQLASVVQQGGQLQPIQGPVGAFPTNAFGGMQQQQLNPMQQNMIVVGTAPVVPIFIPGIGNVYGYMPGNMQLAPAGLLGNQTTPNMMNPNMGMVQLGGSGGMQQNMMIGGIQSPMGMVQGVGMTPGGGMIPGMMMMNPGGVPVSTPRIMTPEVSMTQGVMSGMTTPQGVAMMPGMATPQGVAVMPGMVTPQGVGINPGVGMSIPGTPQSFAPGNILQPRVVSQAGQTPIVASTQSISSQNVPQASQPYQPTNTQTAVTPAAQAASVVVKPSPIRPTVPTTVERFSRQEPQERPSKSASETSMESMEPLQDSSFFEESDRNEPDAIEDDHEGDMSSPAKNANTPSTKVQVIYADGTSKITRIKPEPIKESRRDKTSVYKSSKAKGRLEQRYKKAETQGLSSFLPNLNGQPGGLSSVLPSLPTTPRSAINKNRPETVSRPTHKVTSTPSRNISQSSASVGHEFNSPASLQPNTPVRNLNRLPWEVIARQTASPATIITSSASDQQAATQTNSNATFVSASKQRTTTQAAHAVIATNQSASPQRIATPVKLLLAAQSQSPTLRHISPATTPNRVVSNIQPSQPNSQPFINSANQRIYSAPATVVQNTSSVVSPVLQTSTSLLPIPQVRPTATLAPSAAVNQSESTTTVVLKYVNDNQSGPQQPNSKSVSIISVQNNLVPNSQPIAVPKQGVRMLRPGNGGPPPSMPSPINVPRFVGSSNGNLPPGIRQQVRMLRPVVSGQNVSVTPTDTVGGPQFITPNESVVRTPTSQTMPPPPPVQRLPDPQEPVNPRIVRYGIDQNTGKIVRDDRNDLKAALNSMQETNVLLRDERIQRGMAELDQMAENVLGSDVTREKNIPYLPPNLANLTAMKRLLLQRKLLENSASKYQGICPEKARKYQGYIASKSGGDSADQGETSTNNEGDVHPLAHVLGTPEFKQLQERFMSVFAWPALLSTIPPRTKTKTRSVTASKRKLSELADAEGEPSNKSAALLEQGQDTQNPS